MENNNRHISFMLRFALLTLGSITYALGIALLIDPIEIAPGGVTGIAILLNHFFQGINVGTLILLINIPLLIVCFFRFKLGFTLATVYATTFSSLLVDFLQDVLGQYIPLTSNKMLGSIIGGAVIALGMGLVFHGSACTGGTDIIVKLLRQKFKQFRSGVLFAAIDAIIILSSASIFGIESALYAAICVFVTSFVLDYVLYGPQTAKLVYIISEVPDVIVDRILNELNTGVTFLEGEGAYTGNTQRVILCAFRKHLYKRIRDIVSTEDPKAFMIICSAHEVFGEGFKNPFADEL